VVRAILDVVGQSGERDYYAVPAIRTKSSDGSKKGGKATASQEHEWVERIQALRQEMFLAAENLEFEKAARLRDDLRKLQADVAAGGGSVPAEVAVTNGKPRAAAGTRRPLNKKTSRRRTMR
jgi:excinuclease ABC subunit B